MPYQDSWQSVVKKSRGLVHGSGLDGEVLALAGMTSAARTSAGTQALPSASSTAAELRAWPSGTPPNTTRYKILR